MFTTTPRGATCSTASPRVGPADTVDDDIEVAAELLDAARVVATPPAQSTPGPAPVPASPVGKGRG